MPKRTQRRSYAVPQRAAKPEVNRVLRKLRDLGLQLEFSAGAGHWRVIDPGTGAFLTTVSNTPSDINWWHHIRRAVERAGYIWDGRKARKKIKRPEGDAASFVDLEALAHAQRLARIHGEREPQLDDLADKSFLSKLRQGFNQQETEEAISHMAQGVESGRAHRVVSRLLYIVEERGEQMAARAKERNPKIRDGGAVHEILHVAQQVAAQRGLRYWKTHDSAWNTVANMLSGTSAGMSVWVANLLEATMDELDGLRWDAPSKPEAEATFKSDAPATPMPEAKNAILEALHGGGWTTRADLTAFLVPGEMTESRLEDALRDLVKENLIVRDRERVWQGKSIYRLADAADAQQEPSPEPVAEPEPEPLGDEDLIVVSPEMLPSDSPERVSLLQAMVGGSIADRYANVLLAGLEKFIANGSDDWNMVEPILSRLDKLAGVAAEE